MNELMTTFDKLNNFIERDKTLKAEQTKLNAEIGAWISTDLGFKESPATLCEIVKVCLEKNYAPDTTKTV